MRQSADIMCPRHLTVVLSQWSCSCKTSHIKQLFCTTLFYSKLGLNYLIISLSSYVNVSSSATQSV